MMEERPETPVWVQGGRLLPRDWALKEGSGLVRQRGGAFCGGENEVYRQSLEIQNK